MHNLKYIGMAAIAVVALGAFGGCSDLDGDYDSIVPDNYYTILSLKEIGLQTVEMSVADGEYRHEIAILKGGAHIDEKVDVEVDALDQTWINENYNEKQGTNYCVIPSSMYSFDTYRMSIPSGKSGRSVTVRFNAEKIYEFSKRKDVEGKTLMLPVKIVSSSHDINEERTTALLQLEVSPVGISIESEFTQVKLLDDVSEQTANIVINKTAQFEVPVEFEVMSQSYLDEHYSIPLGVKYKVLDNDMFSMERKAVLPADVDFYKHPFTLNVNKIKAYQGNEVLVLPIIMKSGSAAAVVERGETLVQFVAHEYTFKELTNKGSWSIAYGSMCMPFAPYENMFDGVEDGKNWMSYINDGYPNSANLGKPFVVMNLGKNVMVSGVGVVLGFETGYWDVLPIGVDFYVTNDDSVDAGLSTTEYKSLWGTWDDTGMLSDALVALHKKMRSYDETVNWVKVGSISGLQCNASFNGEYWIQVPNSILNRNINSRYLKIELTPAPYGTSPGDRSAIHELYVNTVATIDGVTVQ